MIIGALMALVMIFFPPIVAVGDVHSWVGIAVDPCHGLDHAQASAPKPIVDTLRECMVSNAVISWSQLQQASNFGYDITYPLLQTCPMMFYAFEFTCMKGGDSRMSCDMAAAEVAKQAITIAGMQCQKKLSAIRRCRPILLALNIQD